MSFGIDPLGVGPFGTGGETEAGEFDPSVLLNRDIVYLVEAYPWDPNLAAETRVGFCDPAQQDRKVIYSGALFPAKLVNSLSVRYRLFQQNLPTGPTEASSIGNIVIAWGDESQDYLTDYYWDGRRINVYIGEPSYEFEQFHRVYTGFIKEVTWNEQFIEFSVEDQLDRLSHVVTESTYTGDGTGSGNYDANPELRGTLKPLTWGRCRNVELVLINPGYDVYQFHDGVALAVDALYDKGILLTKANAGNNDITQMGPLASVFAWTPVARQYITDLARGIVRLGAPAVGAVTGDVRGLNDDADSTHPDRVGELFVHLLKRAGVTDIDTTAASDLDTAYPYQVGFYTGTSQVSYRDVIDRLVHSVFGYWRVDRLGQVSVGRLAVGSPALTISETDVLSIERQETYHPVWKLILNYDPCWMVQDPDGLADAVTPAFRDSVSRVHRQVSSEDGTVETAHLKAQMFEMTTLLASKANAESELAARLPLLKVQKHFYRVQTKNHQWMVTPGSTINVDWPRWGVADKDFIVVGVDENVASGNTTLLLWG